MVELLEQRRLLAAVTNGVLTLGSAADDIYDISVDAQQLIVIENGDRQVFVLASIDSIKAQLGDGNDFISMGGVSIPAFITGGAGRDTIIGGTGNDSLYGGQGADEIRGGAGDDYLHGGKGRDTLRGAAGNDEAAGRTGDDMIFGGEGNDLLQGNEDNDSIHGLAGNDTLYGGIGIDVLGGGSGDDILDGRAGVDTLTGGLGIDTIFFIKDGDVLNRDERDVIVESPAWPVPTTLRNPFDGLTPMPEVMGSDY